MGMARGSVTLLGRRRGAAWATCGVVRVRGDAADVAEAMAGTGAAAAVVVHESALRWWPGAGRAMEAACGAVGDGRTRNTAAAYDFTLRQFRPPAPAPAPAVALRPLGRSVSWPSL